MSLIVFEDSQKNIIEIKFDLSIKFCRHFMECLVMKYNFRMNYPFFINFTDL